MRTNAKKKKKYVWTIKIRNTNVYSRTVIEKYICISYLFFLTNFKYLNEKKNFHIVTILRGWPYR